MYHIKKGKERNICYVGLKISEKIGHLGYI
jgi:hypothetical protein